MHQAAQHCKGRIIFLNWFQDVGSSSSYQVFEEPHSAEASNRYLWAWFMERSGSHPIHSNHCAQDSAWLCIYCSWIQHRGTDACSMWAACINTDWKAFRACLLSLCKLPAWIQWECSLFCWFFTRVSSVPYQRSPSLLASRCLRSPQ